MVFKYRRADNVIPFWLVMHTCSETGFGEVEFELDCVFQYFGLSIVFQGKQGRVHYDVDCVLQDIIRVCDRWVQNEM